MTDDRPVIEYAPITHYYDKRLIYKDLSFSVPRGRILNLLLAVVCLRMFFVSIMPETYNAFLPILIAFTILFLALPMLSIARFQDGKGLYFFQKTPHKLPTKKITSHNNFPQKSPPKKNIFHSKNA